MKKVTMPKVTLRHAKSANCQHVGYVRVSTIDQNENWQPEGLKLNRTFLDKASGKDVHRPQIASLLAFVREGDTVIYHSMDRLGRNLTIYGSLGLRSTLIDHSEARQRSPLNPATLLESLFPSFLDTTQHIEGVSLP